MSKNASKEPRISSRAELIKALQSASELEHLLCCEYLYASFSVRRTLLDFEPGGDEQRKLVLLDRVRPWLSQLNMIARQEMEHLAIATNLLSAVGAEPYLERRNFPISARASLLKAPICLDRFGETSVKRFLWYERPESLTPPFAASCCDTEVPDTGPHLLHQMGIDSIQQLYEEISAAFQTLPAESLFVGNTDQQLGPVFGYRVNMLTITNRAEAVAAVQQILTEGEGIGANPLHSDSHFQRYSEILQGLEESIRADRGFDPSLPVVTNPRVNQHPPHNGANIITRPETVRMMQFFNECYYTMLVMLKTFFATNSSSFWESYFPEPRPQAALFYAAFFPFMTMVIRPLGEILARMPAGAPYEGKNAGASFEIDKPIEITAHGDWYDGQLGDLAKSAQDLMEDVPERLRPAMKYLHENLTSMRLHLRELWRKGQ